DARHPARLHPRPRGVRADAQGTAYLVGSRSSLTSHSNIRPRDQHRPTTSALRAERSTIVTPTRLWPEARRSPSVGKEGATPTPSTDTQATSLSPDAPTRRSTKRERLSPERRESAQVVITIGNAIS